MKRYFIASKNGRFVDETGSILHCDFDSADNRVYVRYRSNPSKSYSYGAERVACVYESKERVIRSDEVCFVCGEKSRNISKLVILVSDNECFGKRVEIIEQGKRRLLSEGDVAIFRKASSNNLFSYLKDVAQAVNSQDESQEGQDYITRQFEHLGNETLADLAVGVLAGPERCTDNDFSLGESFAMFPFGANLSQMQAAENALTSRLSVIEGPSGTGKTQTILNMIANLICRGKTVLVASANNAATDNVAKKLEEHGLGFFVAQLGNKENIDSFVASQDTEKAYPVDLETWTLSPADARGCKDRISVLASELCAGYEMKQRLSKQRERLRGLEHEDRINRLLNLGLNLSCRARTNLYHLRALRSEVERLAQQERNISWPLRFKCCFLWGIGRWGDYEEMTVGFELGINKLILAKEIANAKETISECEEWLEGHKTDEMSRELFEESMRLFKSELASKYASRASKERRQFANPWEEPSDLRAEYPVITSTTHAARNQIGRNGQAFDYIIIDESSQVDVVTGFLALSSAKRAVVVGDCKQLPCVITADAEKQSRKVSRPTDVSHWFDYANQSILSCILGLVGDGEFEAPRTLLKEHYRCSPEIIGFCNERFYGGELIAMTEGNDAEGVSRLTLMADNGGRNYRKDDYNRVQSAMFFREYLPKATDRFGPSQIGVVTPYRGQADGMAHCKDACQHVGLEVDTVHKYQGREKSVMAFVTAANDLNSFVDNSNLVNVAVSRAKDALCLITSPSLIDGDGNIPALARYIAYRNGDIAESKTYPAFPLLYPGLEYERERYLVSRKHSRDDEYSEVQTEEYLAGVLDELGLEHELSFCRNYPLRLFINRLESFSEEEQIFIERSSHADFIVFRRIDRSIVLEIEVNGDQHYRNAEQMHRDSLKASILCKLEIPQVVIRTNEERQTAIEAIREGLLRALGEGRALGDRMFANVTTE